ncbi:MAG: glycosyltransferase [Immundisolibacter sp.]|uniref:glycosyltransferase n=1 Tax=Immundisolibacter sp. TaxID=1934948 RepID=UPI003EE3F2CC
MLTVLFATRNGAPRLPRVLQAFAALEPPTGGWKLVVVENASTDDTGEVLQKFTGHLPLTVLSQPKPGKNSALNLGLNAVAGDLVVLTDDDVLPAADWLLRLRAAADDNPAYDLFGGRIVPKFEVEPPDWLLRWAPLEMAYAATPADLPAGLVDPAMVWGGNMMVRWRVFEAGHRFDENIGPTSSVYAMGSETEFTLRVAQAGYSSWFCPQAVVEHLVRGEQMTEQWLFGRAVRYGRGALVRELVQGQHGGPQLGGVPRSLWGDLIALGYTLARARVSGDRRWRLHARLRFNEALGRVLQARVLAKAGVRVQGDDRAQT